MCVIVILTQRMEKHVCHRYFNAEDGVKHVCHRYFNAEDGETCVSSFLHQYDAKNLIKGKTCFKNLNNPSCVDLIITNSCNSFQNTSTISTGLSDFHKMLVTVLKTKFEKRKAKEIIYRDYKKFDDNHFKRDLRTTHAKGCRDYREFEEIFLNILQKHAPLKKKLIRENQVPYMTKILRKATMRRSQLETKYHKTKTSDDQKTYKKQRILSVDYIKKK